MGCWNSGGECTMHLQHYQPVNSCIAVVGGRCYGGFKTSLFPSSPLDGETKGCLKGGIYLIKGLTSSLHLWTVEKMMNKGYFAKKFFL